MGSPTTELSTIANFESVHFGASWPTVGAIRKPIAMITSKLLSQKYERFGT